MPTNIPARLIEAIKSNKLIVFTGAGTSLKFNLPTWRQLVEDVIKKIDKSKFNLYLPILQDGTSLTPIDVLEIIKEEHHEIRKYIKHNFDITSNDLDLHKNLLELSGKIITTNYDNAFEKADNTIIETLPNSIFNISELNKSAEKYIFKIHGSFKEPDTCIIFKDDYSKAYGNETAATNKIKSIFSDHTILFVGFGFNDPYVNALFKSLDEVYGNNNKHFILTPELDKFSQFSFLDVIPTSYDEIDNYILECLNYKANSEQIEPAVTPNKTTQPRIAILFPDCLDLSLKEHFNSVDNSFNNLNVQISTGYLNFKTLQLIDDYDCLVVISKVYKKKLYIEGEYLKSELISLKDFYDNVLNDRIFKIIITDEGAELDVENNTIHISSYKTNIINRVVFKFLRNGELDFQEEVIKVSNDVKFNFKIEKGKRATVPLHGIRKALEFGKKSSSHIIGRIEELSAMTSRLMTSMVSNKLLNVKGSGGIGKTSLVKKISSELYERGYFNEGISFVSCENVKTYNDFEDLLLYGFNLQNIVNFREYLLTNNIKFDLLIILDNFETVTNIDSKEDFRKILSLLNFSIDYANIVITSRENLGVEFELIYSLTPLITDDALNLFLREYGNISASEEIKILRVDILENLLNNNPLAIKLVTTSKTRFKHIVELKNQLESNFFESTSADFTQIYQNTGDLNIERTRSIYQSINYSYLKLGTLERLAFEILHLFPDGISLADFKKCFARKVASNNFSEKELRSLRDKSLIEDDNGNLYLQPIIRRFAEFQFFKRPKEIKEKYYIDAFRYNNFFLNLIRYINSQKNFSIALKVHDSYKTNLLNVLDYMQKINVIEKNGAPSLQSMLKYVQHLSGFILNENTIEDYQFKLNELKDFFAQVPDAHLLLDVLGMVKTYYYKDFDVVYDEMTSILSPTDMENRIFSSENFSETAYRDLISSIHSMEGHTVKYINMFIKNNVYKTSFDNDLFYLGVPNKIEGQHKRFIEFEYDLITGMLDIKELQTYIKNLFTGQTLETMQCTYTLSKAVGVNINIIQKLIVTNPYTNGLKELMLAFHTNDIKEKKIHFKNALKYLYHIKYYYLEALYFYCKFLKVCGDDEYSAFYSEGLAKSEEFYYQYLIFKFKNINSESVPVYTCDLQVFPMKDFAYYLGNYKKEWAKYLQESAHYLS